GQLESIGDASHVMALANPPHDIDCPLAPKMIDEHLKISRRDRAGVVGLFPREREGGTLGGREAGPVSAAQALAKSRDGVLAQARDRELHLGVAHSVKTVDVVRHQPENVLLKKRILIRLIAESVRAGRPGIGKLRLISSADKSPARRLRV